MTQYPLPLRIIFSWTLLLLCMGCGKSTSNTTSFSPIETFNLYQSSTHYTHNYDIKINHQHVGSASVTILKGVYKPSLGGNVTQFNQKVTLNDQSGEHDIFIDKDLYTIKSEHNDIETHPIIPRPIMAGEKIVGPYGITTTDNVTLYISGVHSTFKSDNGHIFERVIEAENSDQTLRLFFNETYFIIQKEDDRYVPTIQTIQP